MNDFMPIQHLHIDHIDMYVAPNRELIHLDVRTNYMQRAEALELYEWLGRALLPPPSESPQPQESKPPRLPPREGT